MKTSDIITSQFVSLTQTPAGVAERLVARIIDYIVIGVYFFFYSLDCVSGDPYIGYAVGKQCDTEQNSKRYRTLKRIYE